MSKRLGSRYRSGRSPDWLKFKNPDAPAVRREAEEDWGRCHHVGSVVTSLNAKLHLAKRRPLGDREPVGAML